MEAVQAITGSGGWPMSMFLTPDRRPFFGGTYFPPADRPGLPGFRTVLDALTDVWDNRRSEVEEQADELSAGDRLAVGDPPTRGGRFAVRLGRPRRGRCARPVGHRAGGAGRPLRPAVGRVRRCPQVPPAGPGGPGPLPLASRRSGSAPPPTPGRWPSPPWTPWPRAASTTTSGAASPATRPMPNGWCPTSRRCSTTRPACCGPSSTAGRSPAARTISTSCPASSPTWAGT